MDVYIARHGATEWNLVERLCGRTDLPLSETGVTQAHALGERLAGEGITLDRIYASSLTRARQTAEIVARYVAAPIVTDERLVEQSFGENEGIGIHLSAYLTCKQNLALRCPGGESAMDVACRIYGFLEELKQQSGLKAVLLVGHGSAMRVLHTYFADDVRNEVFLQWSIGNAEYRLYRLPKSAAKR